MKTAKDFLDQAVAEMADRSGTYDKPEGDRSMGATVEAFNAITGTRLSETDGWLFMAVLKMVRTKQGGFRADSFVDGSAYMALAGESASKDEDQVFKIRGWQTGKPIPASAMTRLRDGIPYDDDGPYDPHTGQPVGEKPADKPTTGLKRPRKPKDDVESANKESIGKLILSKDDFLL